MNFLVINAGIPDSASRQLDSRVAGSELPYGYEGEYPPSMRDSEISAEQKHEVSSHLKRKK